MARVLSFEAEHPEPAVDLHVDEAEFQQDLATLRALRPFALKALANHARAIATKLRQAADRKRRHRY